MTGKQPFPHDSQNGFTLLEILIAITILGVLMVGDYTIVNNSSDLQESVKKEDRGLIEMETAMARLELDFAFFYSPLFYSVIYRKDEAQRLQKSSNLVDRQAYLAQAMSSLDKFTASDRFPGISKRGVPVPAFLDEDKGELVFMTASNRRKFQNSKQSHYAWVRYYLDDQKIEEGDPDKAGMLQLMRQVSSTNPYADEFSWDKIKAHVLLRNLKEFRFMFWDKGKEKFVDALRDITAGIDTLRLMCAEFVLYDPAGNELKFLRSFRMSWPWFDSVADDNELQKAITPTNEAEGETPVSNRR